MNHPCHGSKEKEDGKGHNSGLKLQEAKFHMNIRKNLLSVTAVLLTETLEEQITMGSGERSNMGGVQEERRQPLDVHSLDSMAFLAPSHFVTLGFA